MRRKIRGFFFVAFAINTLLACNGAVAQELGTYVDGNALFADFMSTDPQVRMSGAQYVIAVIDTVHFLSSTKVLRVPVFCVPAGVQIGQARDVVKKHLENHPEERHYTAVSEVVGALRAAFPCPQSKTK